MNGWVLSSAMVMGAAIAVVAQEVNKRPAAPPLPPPTFSPLPLPAPTPSAAATVPVQPVSPRAFPTPMATPAPAMGALTALKFDSERKEYSSKPGEMQAPFTFHLTNTSSSAVSITSVRTSCGCTVAKLPSTPWVVEPGQGGPIDVTVNLAGKSGMITKSVTVESSAGVKSLLVSVNVGGSAGAPGAIATAPHPMMNDADRLKNMQLSLADRQHVFKNKDCATCHADPAKGQVDGRQIYAGVCATCHDSVIRAAMVPDLKTLKHPTDADYWRNWITYGRAGSMMPAFSQAEGGPLTPSQIEALVAYTSQAFPGSRLPRVLQSRQSASVVSPAVAIPPVPAAAAPQAR